jgi:hypothetical protein
MKDETTTQQHQHHLWSEYPQEAYTVTLLTGHVTGLGVHPAFSTAPGAWNIFWLTYSVLDSLAYYKGDPLDYFYTCDELPVCVGAALQIVPEIKRNKKDVTYGQLALDHTPMEFIKLVKPDKENFLPIAYYGDSWFSVAENNALRYKERTDNIVHHDFRNTK